MEKRNISNYFIDFPDPHSSCPGLSGTIISPKTTIVVMNPAFQIALAAQLTRNSDGNPVQAGPP